MQSSASSRADDSGNPHHYSPASGPYGHPFHPLLVTIPIGAWVCSLVFDIATRAKSAGSPGLVDASYWLIGIGVLGAALAAIFGLMDLLHLPRGTRAFATGFTHMLLNTVILAAYVVNWFWRHGDHAARFKVSGGQMTLSIIAIVILLVSGWLGGKLTYRYGSRVAELSTQAEGFTGGVQSPRPR